MRDTFHQVAVQARACRVCQPFLDHPCRPILTGTEQARIRIIGQAPGTRVQKSGTPFTDPSGDRLREWLGVSQEEFYDETLIAITPMGFCFPGLTEKGSDKPPRKECAPLWQDRCSQSLTQVELTLLIGQYAQKHYLKDARGRSLTETVLQWREHWPDFVAMPHPSWRNNAWLKKNPWFERDVLPKVKSRIRSIILSVGQS